MLPLVQTWFERSFEDVTEPQAYSIPVIHQRKNVLISSPTGSGKTLTAFLSIINELMLKQEKGELKNEIYCVYVSPLKALANDIDKNLKQPLAELGELAKELGMEVPEIRVGVRTGDTTSYERQKMSRKPPHILITTPESLAIVLTTPKFSENLKSVEWLITDEIHEICNSKRGSMLSITLERLQSRLEKDAARIGLSATQSPIREIARFLGGYENGKERDVSLVQAEGGKDFDIKVITPVDDITSLPFEIVNARMYERLKEMIDDTRTTLVFTNTRSGTEQVMLKLGEMGLEDIAAHHGSLSRETRLDVEDRLKNGELKAAISSTSLELGIDIGSIDLVCQIGSPKSIAKGLQRVGRAGHGVGQQSKGRFMVFDNDDLVECAVLAKSAVDHDIDRVSIPENPLDVLAQTIVGLSLEKRWDIEEAYSLIRNSYAYHKLTKKDYMSVLRYLGSRDMPNVYSKIWLDEEEGTFGLKKGSRLIYYLNSGTIPEEANFKVFSDKGGRLGELSEGFVEKLGPGDVFVLGGKSYRFERARGMSLYVKDATGKRPTVPSWTGEMLPRSFDLSVNIGKFRELVTDRIRELDPEKLSKKEVDKKTKELREWLIENYHLDGQGANSIISYFREQLAFSENVPSDRDLLVEEYVDKKGNTNLIFHFCFGRRVNDALSRAYAMILSDKYDTNISVSITDDNFMLTLPKEIPLENFDGLINEKELVGLLERAVGETELFKHRFRHCSTRGLMVLRNYQGRSVPVGRQQQRAQKVLRAISDADDFPLVKETYREIMTTVMDLENARDIIRSIEAGKRVVHYSRNNEIPSPFSHSVVLSGMSDIVLMHDRSALLKEMHRKVLDRIGGAGSIKPEFKTSVVKEHFAGKLLDMHVRKKDDIIPLMRMTGPMELFQRKDRSIYDFSDVEADILAEWCKELVNDGEVHSIWAGRSLWIPSDIAASYASIYRSDDEITQDGQKVMDIMADAKKPISTRIISNKLEAMDGIEWDNASTRKVLNSLERRYLTAKTQMDGKGFGLWGELVVEPAPEGEKYLKDRVMNHLDLFAPLSIEELSFEMRLPEEVLEGVLESMQSEVEVMAKSFTEPYVQYMLAQDYSDLKSTGEEITISPSELSNYRTWKHFNGFKNIDDFFERYGSVGMLNDVVTRMGLEGIEDWGEKRRSGDVLQGRFWDGSVCFVRKQDAPKFINAFRKEELGKVDKQILKIISDNPGADIIKIHEISEIPKDALKPIVEKLDRNMHIARKPADRTGFNPNYESWATRNKYYKLGSKRSSVDGKAWLLKKLISAYGPVSMYDLARSAGMRRDEIRNYLLELRKTGKLAEVSVIGSEGQKLYIWEKEVKSLRSGGGKGYKQVKEAVRILTIFDPSTFHHKNEIRMKYGDAWYYTIFRGSKLIGMMEMWEMSGCLEIRELDLDDPDDLPDVLKAIDDFSEFYKRNYHEVIRITGAFRESVVEMDKKYIKVFEKAGYFRSRNWLLKGDVVDLTLTDENVVSYLLWKQHILPERHFEDMETGLIKLGGFKSDHEAALRVDDAMDLKQMLKDDMVERGQVIPEYLTFVLPDELAMYKAAKGVEVDREMSYIVGILDREHKMKRNQLIEAVPLSYENGVEALNRLIKGLHVLRGKRNLHYLSPMTNYSQEKGREEVLWLIIDSFGIFSAENLSLYTKSEYKMGEIRRALSKFEKQGKLVKGYISEDDNLLYWLVKEDVPKLPMEPHDVNIILAPSAYDRLSTYLMPFTRKKFGFGSCFIVISGGAIVGVFRANMRRTELLVGEYRGQEEGWDMIRDYAIDIGRRMTIKEKEGAISEDEIMDWYDKTSGREFN